MQGLIRRGEQTPRWARGWRGVVVGVIVCVLVAAILTAITKPARAAEQRVPVNHVTPAMWVYQFNHGLLGRAPGTINYGPTLKGRTLTKMRAAWLKKYPGKTFDAAAQWKRFVAQDSCSHKYTLTAPSNLPTECAFGKGRWTDPHPEKYNTIVKRVVFCGANAVVLYGSGGTLIWVGAGSGLCYWGTSL